MNQPKTKIYVMLWQCDKDQRSGQVRYVDIDEFKKYITKEEK